MKKEIPTIPAHCQRMVTGVKDTQDLLSGKWKTSILGVLFYKESLRFMDLKRELFNIAPRMLSKELKDLEMNHLIKRTVIESYPIKIEYTLTEEGKSLNKVIQEMADWGIGYRERLLNGKIAQK